MKLEYEKRDKDGNVEKVRLTLTKSELEAMGESGLPELIGELTDKADTAENKKAGIVVGKTGIVVGVISIIVTIIGIIIALITFFL